MGAFQLPYNMSPLPLASNVEPALLSPSVHICLLAPTCQPWPPGQPGGPSALPAPNSAHKPSVPPLRPSPAHLPTLSRDSLHRSPLHQWHLALYLQPNYSANFQFQVFIYLWRPLAPIAVTAYCMRSCIAILFGLYIKPSIYLLDWSSRSQTHGGKRQYIFIFGNSSPSTISGKQQMLNNVRRGNEQTLKSCRYYEYTIHSIQI